MKKSQKTKSDNLSKKLLQNVNLSLVLDKPVPITIPETGDIYYNPYTGEAWVYNSTEWMLIKSNIDNDKALEELTDAIDKMRKTNEVIQRRMNKKSRWEQIVEEEND